MKHAKCESIVIIHLYQDVMPEFILFERFDFEIIKSLNPFLKLINLTDNVANRYPYNHYITINKVNSDGSHFLFWNFEDFRELTAISLK